MNEAVIFAELLQLISKEEQQRLKSLMNDRQTDELKSLLVQYLKKYRNYLSYSL